LRYVYSLVRFVPDPARGEFVNVGAIVGSDESSEWDLRQVENPVRARAVDDRKSLEAVWMFMDSMGRAIDDHQRATQTLFAPEVELSESWLEGVYASHRNIVQLSPPAPMVADSADEALDRVFDLLVVDPAHRRYRFQKKHVALAAVRAAYVKHFLRTGVDIKERCTLETPAHKERLDFAVANGSVVQLTHTWSFQVPDQDMLAEQVKAWGWTVHDLRGHGGVLAVGERLYEAPRDVDVEVVYVPPGPEQEAPAWRDARNVFEELGVRYGALDHADAVGAAALQLLVTSRERLDIRPGQP
jgi:hypothetical protein